MQEEFYDGVRDEFIKFVKAEIRRIKQAEGSFFVLQKNFKIYLYNTLNKVIDSYIGSSGMNNRNLNINDYLTEDDKDELVADVDEKLYPYVKRLADIETGYIEMLSRRYESKSMAKTLAEEMKRYIDDTRAKGKSIQSVSLSLKTRLKKMLEKIGGKNTLSSKAQIEIIKAVEDKIRKYLKKFEGTAKRNRTMKKVKHSAKTFKIRMPKAAVPASPAPAENEDIESMLGAMSKMKIKSPEKEKRDVNIDAILGEISKMKI